MIQRPTMNNKETPVTLEMARVENLYPGNPEQRPGQYFITGHLSFPICWLIHVPVHSTSKIPEINLILFLPSWMTSTKENLGMCYMWWKDCVIEKVESVRDGLWEVTFKLRPKDWSTLGEEIQEGFPGRRKTWKWMHLAGWRNWWKKTCKSRARTTKGTVARVRRLSRARSRKA